MNGRDDDRHPIMDAPHEIVGRTRDDREGADPLVGPGPQPVLPYAGQGRTFQGWCLHLLKMLSRTLGKRGLNISGTKVSKGTDYGDGAVSRLPTRAEGSSLRCLPLTTSGAFNSTATCDFIGSSECVR